jgi:hypothetical protein
MKPAKPFTQMSAAELAEATKQYDAMVFDKTRPLSPKERKLWEHAKRVRGRPRVGRGARKISISPRGRSASQGRRAGQEKGHEPLGIDRRFCNRPGLSAMRSEGGALRFGFRSYRIAQQLANAG